MRRNLKRVCFMLCAGAMLGALPAAQAQTADKAPAKKPTDVPSQDPNVPLSKKLNQNEGVLKPPAGVDPQIHQEPPASTGDKMPVIIPPGEPGGDQSVQPK
jgi:hypothetical protein